MLEGSVTGCASSSPSLENEASHVLPSFQMVKKKGIAKKINGSDAISNLQKDTEQKEVNRFSPLLDDPLEDPMNLEV